MRKFQEFLCLDLGRNRSGTNDSLDRIVSGQGDLLDCAQPNTDVLVQE